MISVNLLNEDGTWRSLRDTEIEILKAALSNFRTLREVCDVLNISRSALALKIEKYAIERPDGRRKDGAMKPPKPLKVRQAQERAREAARLKKAKLRKAQTRAAIPVCHSQS